MKKWICFMMTAILCAAAFTACGNNNRQQEASGSTEEQAGKVLVVYYSATGNTKAVGDAIAQYTGGDVFEIIPVNAYTNENLDWREEGSRVNQEHEDESLQDIELVSATVDNFDSYDTIFIGYEPDLIGLNQEKPSKIKGLH